MQEFPGTVMSCTHYQNGLETSCVLCTREKITRYHAALKHIVSRIEETGDDAPADLIYAIHRIAVEALKPIHTSTPPRRDPETPQRRF
jgi:hypothetical protein